MPGEAAMGTTAVGPTAGPGGDAGGAPAGAMDCSGGWATADPSAAAPNPPPRPPADAPSLSVETLPSVSGTSVAMGAMVVSVATATSPPSMV